MFLNEGERLDDLQIKGLYIIQKTNGFCFGTDAVLLAGFASVKKGGRVMDLCTGTGIIPLLLSVNFSNNPISISLFNLNSIAFFELIFNSGLSSIIF